jgi:hypothetical protein
MTKSEVSWRYWSSKKRGILTLNERLTLEDESGNVVFDVAPADLLGVKMQMHMLYLKTRHKTYSLNLSPEAHMRAVENGAGTKEIGYLDQITSEWKDALAGAGVKRVKRIPWWLIFLITSIATMIRLLL